MLLLFPVVIGKEMAAFTSEEYADMLLAYGSANTNSREARRIYQERYPNRRVPSHQTFASTYRRLRQTGNLNFQEPRVNVARPDTTIDEQVLAEFDADPTKSIRQIASMLGLSIWKVWSVLRVDGRHAFHYTPVQGKILSYLCTASDTILWNVVNYETVQLIVPFNLDFVTFFISCFASCCFFAHSILISN